MRLFCCTLLLAVNLMAGLEEDLAVGFDHFYNLEYDQSIAAFERAAAANPASPLPQDGIAQAVLYREMFRNGALESELIDGNNSFLRRPKLEATQDTTTRFFNAINKALELSQAQININPRDKTALHARAVIFMDSPLDDEGRDYRASPAVANGSRVRVHLARRDNPRASP